MADWEERGRKMEEAGKNMQRMGCMLTGLITIPLIGAVIAGPFGLMVGALIGGLIFYAVRKQQKEEAEKGIGGEKAETEDTYIDKPKPRIVTINARPTKKFTDLIAEGVKVAGISHRQDVVERLVEGGSRKILLEKEPDNIKDENAIKVMGHWQEDAQKFIEQVGYVPKEIAAEIAENYSDYDLQGCLKIIYRPTEDKNAGMLFDIYGAPR